MSENSSSQSFLRSLRFAAGRLYADIVNTYGKARSALLMDQYDRRRRKAPHDGPIRVGFIAQMPEVWDKQMSLFSFMLEDPRFDPCVIYLNHYDFVKKEISPDKNDKQFYEALYGPENVRDFFTEPSFSLDDFDYLFYDRPYNNYFPECLQTTQAMKHARLCMINYGADDWEMPFFYPSFAMGIRLWFGSNTHEYKIHRDLFGHSRHHRVFDIGYPAYEYYHALETVPGRNRILWTPRWSYNEQVGGYRIGGSHFFEYVNQLIAFAESHDVTLVIRPHPLMFENLIHEKMMTEDDLRKLKERCAEAGVRFDPNRIVADTFRETDILISDYSSILGLFLASGKPIIYCPSGIPLNDECLLQVNSMYHAESWEQVESALLRLLDGDDPMKEKREAVINSSLLKRRGSVRAIADVVAQDYST